MKKMYCIAVLVLSALTLVSCSFQRIVAGQNNENYRNPHTTCAPCHGAIRPKADAPFPTNVDPAIYCLDCHNYNVNHHPVNFAPAFPIDSLFPLYDGKVTCLTCHEIHGGPQHTGTSRLLRGGAYDDRRAICFVCHSKEQYARLDPHIMKDGQGNQMAVNGASVCLFCHELKPDPSQDKANTVLFKADIGFLCWRCHPLMHGDFLDRHFLVSPPDEILANMKRQESEEEKFALPLVPRGRITCSTCHNPHQEGIISNEAAAAGAGSLHRLRNEDICEGCHNK